MSADWEAEAAELRALSPKHVLFLCVATPRAARWRIAVVPWTVTSCAAA